jgi:hypothetical protein
MPLQAVGCKTIILVAVIKNSSADLGSELGIIPDLIGRGLSTTKAQRQSSTAKLFSLPVCSAGAARLEQAAEFTRSQVSPCYNSLA